MKNSFGRMKPTQGFTLTELLITLTIAGILAGVAIPAYNNTVYKTRRTEAKTEMENIAAQQESYYYRNNVYSQALADFGYGGSRSGAQKLTNSGYYKLQIVQEGSGNCTGNTAPKFTCTRYYIRTRPFGPQADDPWLYRLYADGRKGRCKKKNTTNYACVSGTFKWNWAE